LIVTRLLGSADRPSRACLGVALCFAQDAARIDQSITVRRCAAIAVDAIDGFQCPYLPTTLAILLDGEHSRSRVSFGVRHRLSRSTARGRPLTPRPLRLGTLSMFRVTATDHGAPARAGSGDLDHADGDGQIKAPMHGKVLALLVPRRAGRKGQRLAVIEAMKMEHCADGAASGPVAGMRCGRRSDREGARLMTIEVRQAPRRREPLENHDIHRPAQAIRRARHR